ncbi:MAG TPA: (2Fe-2S)-binding protein [Burkholderiaceae bacterium]|nr:(2Fe-2S)-binding protein [Burkholderiaceae bacterium]
MIVCVCKAVSDRHLGALVSAGCDSVEQLQLETGCGTRCGTCLPHVEALVSRAAGGSESAGSALSAGT